MIPSVANSLRVVNMAASIEVTTTGTAETDGTFTVQWEVTDTSAPPDSIPAEIFVHKFSTRKFDHVANAGDLIYPTAEDPNVAFYRKALATENFPDIDTAEAAKTNVAAAVQAFVDVYNNNLTAFLTPDVTTYPVP